MPEPPSRPTASTTVFIASRARHVEAGAEAAELPRRPCRPACRASPTIASSTSGCAPSRRTWAICGQRTAGPSARRGSPERLGPPPAADAELAVRGSSITRSSAGRLTAARPSAALARTTPRPSRRLAIQRVAVRAARRTAARSTKAQRAGSSERRRRRRRPRRREALADLVSASPHWAAVALRRRLRGCGWLGVAAHTPILAIVAPRKCRGRPHPDRAPRIQPGSPAVARNRTRRIQPCTSQVGPLHHGVDQGGPASSNTFAASATCNAGRRSTAAWPRVAQHRQPGRLRPARSRPPPGRSRRSRRSACRAVDPRDVGRRPAGPVDRVS